MTHNPFTRVMTKKSDLELEQIVINNETYAKEARLAAARELENRGKLTKDANKIKNDISDTIKVEQEIKSYEARFFSKNTIYLWAFILTPLVVGPFMAFNIWDMGTRKGIWTVLLIIVMYIPFISLILAILPSYLDWLVAVVHSGYTVFFVEWTWKKYLPTFEEYKMVNKRSSK